MKHWITGIAVSAFLLVGSAAHAVQVWNTLEFKVEPGKEGTIAKAIGDFQKTKAGQDREASVALYRILFNGVSPATHVVTVLYPSRAENETSAAKLAASAEFRSAMATVNSASEQVYDSSNETIKGWGTVSNDDKVWVTIRLDVSSPGALIQAMDELMASPKYKEFPGQVWLSSIAFGNAVVGGVANFVVTIGYASQAEMEKWDEATEDSAAALTFLAKVEKASKVINRTLVTQIGVWNHSLSLEDYKQ